MSQEKIRKILQDLTYCNGLDAIQTKTEAVDQALAEINKVVMGCLPKEHDIRSEITEWLVDKNRDEANGFNKAITEFKDNWEDTK